jgi:hypothetical protein
MLCAQSQLRIKRITCDKKRPSAKKLKNQNIANFLSSDIAKISTDFQRIVSLVSLLTSMRCNSQVLVQVNIFSWIWPRRFRSSENKKTKSYTCLYQQGKRFSSDFWLKSLNPKAKINTKFGFVIFSSKISSHNKSPKIEIKNWVHTEKKWPKIEFITHKKKHCTVGTSDFDAQMSAIQIKKGNEILRPVYKKPFSEILSGC